MVTLESIAFDHDPGSWSHDALSIRQNAGISSLSPEWRRLRAVNPEDCRVAYAMATTKANTLTVRATFRRSSRSINSVTIRTFNPTIAAGCLYAILVRLGFTFVIGPPPAIVNALGEVNQTTISFGGEDVVTVDLELRDTQIWTLGVGIYDDTWHWQYLDSSGTWTEFQLSRHRAYVVVDRPQAPWTPESEQPPYSSLLWTDVLDFACEWARGQQSIDGAAIRITARVNDLGRTIVNGAPLLGYDCAGSGGTNYAAGLFDCTSLIDRLRGGYGKGPFVNCTDCACIVTTFANALGCDLWSARMEASFRTNPIRLIGWPQFETRCKSLFDTSKSQWEALDPPQGPYPQTYRPEFTYHEVAWKLPCAEDQPVFDACLELNNSPNPAQPIPLVAANMLFGRPGDGNYRDRLVPPTDVSKCQPTNKRGRPWLR